ncbi:MAG: GumC family protein [Blastocatellia bacterium]
MSEENAVPRAGASGEEKNKLERVRESDEAILIRPSGAAPISSMDQFAYSYNREMDAEDGFNVRDIWRKVRKRKWLVLLIVVIATTIVAIESFRTKSMYQATAKVARSNENPTVLKFGDAILEADGAERIKTDLLLLRTYPLLGKVVVRLKLDENPDFMEVGARKSVLEAVSTMAEKFGGESAGSALGPKPDPIPPQIDGSLSEGEIERLSPYIATLDGYLYVGQINETKAIEISYTHTDPAIAAKVANGVAQAFVDESFSNKTSRFTNSTNWLERTTRALLAQVQQAEQELANYGSNNNFFTTDDKQNLVVEKLGNLYGQALKSETDRKIQQSLYEEVKQGRVASLPEAFSDARTLAQQGEVGKLQVLLAQLSARFGPENPKVVETRQQITELERLISESSKKLEDKLRADYERSMRDERLIKESLEEAKAEAIQQNQASIRFNILKQNVETTKALYNDFLQKTNQASIEKAQQGSDLRIIEPARVPASPTGPRRMRAILIGLLLSLVAGVGLTLLLEYLDNTVKSVEDVARATQLPTLALIPAMDAGAMKAIGGKKNNQRKEIISSSKKVTAVGGLAPRGLQPQGEKLAALDSLSSVVEAYRMLRTSVLLSTAGTPPKTILVTSSQPGEGKTTTAVNTAISLAQLGVSVLLIDADLRRPAVHKAFKIPHNRGISNYLVSNTPIEDLVIKLPIPNLSVLPCGPIPPNPAELISSDRMKDLLRTLGEQYDHILIDSPPLVSVTDPVILSTMVDGSILVVQSGKSTRDLVRRARRELAGVGSKIFGVVLNNVDIKREGYDDYYYYRYNQSYGGSATGAKAS